MRIFLHVCCAPCYIKALSGFREVLPEQTEIMGFWYNPNIHPLIEYRRRLKSFMVFSGSQKLQSKISDIYGLTEFCRRINGAEQVPQRCKACYEMRMSETAKQAKESGFDAFSTTLCTSLHQSHELIHYAGEAAANKYGIKFIYHDLRKYEPDEKTLKGIYRQQYCGCIFSEYDRYKDTTLHLYKKD